MTSYCVLRYEEIDGFRIVSQFGQDRPSMFVERRDFVHAGFLQSRRQQGGDLTDRAAHLRLALA